MDRNQWRSPSFRERSPHTPRPHRFHHEGGFGSRQFSPQQWRPRHHSPSPYRPQNSFDGNLYSPQQRSPFGDFMTSTPYQSHGRRPYRHRGGGRFNKRSSFGSPQFGSDRSADDINTWISPEMWDDPWKHLIRNSSSTEEAQSSALFCTPSNSNTRQVEDDTHFADTDFDVSDEMGNELKTKDESENASIQSDTSQVESIADAT